MGLIAAGALVAVIAAITWEAFKFQGEPALYPMIVSVGALVFSAGYLVLKAVHAWQGRDAVPSLGLAPSGLVYLGGFLGVWVAYIFVLPVIGFIAASWIALTASLAIAGRRVSLITPLYTAVFVVLLSVLLRTVFYVPVPEAFLDRQLDILLYRGG